MAGNKPAPIRSTAVCQHNYHYRRRGCGGAFHSVPCSPPRSPPPSPVSRAQLNQELASTHSIPSKEKESSSSGVSCTDCNTSPQQCPYFFHRLDFELERIAMSIPMSLNKAVSLSRCFLESGPHSRGESTLELEAIAACHQLSFAAQSIYISEMLPRTPELIFVNITTLEGQPYCLELTAKGWRVTSLRADCMQGDFTRLELFIKYYDNLFEVMEVISPIYKQRFTEKLEQRLRLLETEDDGLVAPASSYMTSPCFQDNSTVNSKSSVSSASSQSSSSSSASCDGITSDDVDGDVNTTATSEVISVPL